MRFENEDEAGEAIAQRAERVVEMADAEHLVGLLDTEIERLEAEEAAAENRRTEGSEGRANTGALFAHSLKRGSAAARRFEAAGGQLEDCDCDD